MVTKDKFLLQNKREFVDNFWLGLGDVTKIPTTNIIGNSQLFKENPALGIVDFMRRPENFSYTCATLFDYHLYPYQANILELIWKHPFTVFVAARGAGKSSLLALYALLRAIFIPGSKIIFVGAAFRQSKIIFNYCEGIFRNAPMFQDIFYNDTRNKIEHNTDMYVFHIGESTITSIPLADGQKVRGLRSTCTISDERNSLNDEVYQEVIQGFGSVALNPVEQTKEFFKYKAMLELGDISKDEFIEIESRRVFNQQVDSGTCGYVFEPLYRIWKRHYEIIHSCGDLKKIQHLFPNGVEPGFDHRDYATARLSYDMLPPKYMDEKTISKAKATSHIGIFLNEFCACFLTDTQGFFPRTLIEKCVCNKNPNTPITKKCGKVDFTIITEGESKARYVMGIDPASEYDNFALVILEIWEDHRRIVYTWTTNSSIHKAKLKHGLIQKHIYYEYCADKIRELMQLFNINEIAMDAQGGGNQIAEILGDPHHVPKGQHPILPIEDINDPKPTDHLEGLHILHLIEFANADWTSEANHNLKQDMETRELVFPACDNLSFGLLHEQDKMSNRVKLTDNYEVDSLTETAEDILFEIEELKNELVLIEHTKTPNGRDKWDTPVVKGLNQKKGRLHKDRYSALLLANSIGRSMIPRTTQYKYDVMGGFAKDIVKVNKSKDIVDIDKGFSFGMGVKRR